jgi:hypothetical protein
MSETFANTAKNPLNQKLFSKCRPPSGGRMRRGKRLNKSPILGKMFQADDMSGYLQQTELASSQSRTE